MENTKQYNPHIGIGFILKNKLGLVALWKLRQRVLFKSQAMCQWPFGAISWKGRFYPLNCPISSIDLYEGNRVTVKDVKEKGLIDVFYKNWDLQFEKDNGNNCMHTRFIWMTPEISKIKTIGNKIDS